MKHVGVLALQGDVPQHAEALARLLPSAAIVEVRSREALATVDAVAMPGGESTTIDRLLKDTGLDRALTARVAQGLPVLATCAGLVLAARSIEPSPDGRDPTPLGLLDVAVRRNDFGRQRDSFEAPVELSVVTGPPFPGVFIRSPRIRSVGPGATPIARWGEEVVGARQGAVWGLCFHPELTEDDRLLRAFLRSAGFEELR